MEDILRRLSRRCDCTFYIGGVKCQYCAAGEEIERLRAENQALREALECIAGGEIYPREVAREALAAKEEGK